MDAALPTGSDVDGDVIDLRADSILSIRADIARITAEITALRQTNDAVRATVAANRFAVGDAGPGSGRRGAVRRCEGRRRAAAVQRPWSFCPRHPAI
jgi:hypothetical protein